MKMIKKAPRVPDTNRVLEVQFIEAPSFVFRACWTARGLLSFGFETEMSVQPEIPCTTEQPIHSKRCISSDRINSVETVHSNEDFALDSPLPKDIYRLTRKLSESTSKYFRTGSFSWNLGDLDWRGVSPFHRQVLEACYRIAKGEVLTYGELAAQVGSPLAARAVGSAMAKNRWPLLIPCHRVVGSTGKLTGYSGLGGIETKRRLLKLEGACIS